MTNMTSRFNGQFTVQTNFVLDDISGHEMSMMEVHGLQSSSDENWKDAKVHYWVAADTIHGSGQQRGYFINEHTNGDRDCGTFEGKISSSVQGQISLEGTWKYTHGTGKFSNLSGNGRFKGEMISPTEVNMSIEGSYQLVAENRAA